MNSWKSLLKMYYFSFLSFIALVGVLSPQLNWDMIPYVTSAKHIEIQDAESLHKGVFSDLSKVLNERQFEVYTQGDSYRKGVYEDPAVLIEQLPFYETRVLYNYSVLLLSKLGVDIYKATYYISVLSVVLATVLLYLGLKEAVPSFVLFLLPIVMLATGVVELARLSTPDALGFLSISVLIYLLQKNKLRFTLILLPFIVLVRTDLILFSGFLYLLVLMNKQVPIRYTLLSFVTTIFIYLFINSYYGNYGWQTIFYFTFIKQTLFPSEIGNALTLGDYGLVFLKGLYNSFREPAFWLFIVISFISIFLCFKTKIKIGSNKLIIFYILTPVFYVIAHFLLFPTLWTRFFTGFYIMSFIGLSLLLNKLYENYQIK